MRGRRLVAAVLAAAVALAVPSVASAAPGDEPVALVGTTHCTKTSAEILAGLQDLKGQDKFTTVRHRGDFDATTPENSIQAFRNSYQYCRPGVETDLRHTSDGKLVMFHDTNIGKMMEPTYVPETGQGPNAALESMTLDQLRQKTLVDISRQPTQYKLLTFDEFLDDAVQQDARSLLYVEVKTDSDIMKAVTQVRDFHLAHPDAKIFDRVVFKIRLSAYPTFSLWTQALSSVSDLPRTPLTQVMVSRVIADTVDKRGDLGNPSDLTPSYYATKTWAQASATADGVLSVEVTIKDSTGFYSTTKQTGRGSRAPFTATTMEEYYAPANLLESNTRTGTMAQLVALVHASNKPLGQFVPIPDWVLWRKGFTDWNRTLPSVVGNGSTITPKDAYFQNDSRCCYALQYRVADTGNDPEQNDLRILLPWQEDLGATILTADDTDSIEYYFEGRGKHYDLGKVWDGRIAPAQAEMNSLISANTNQRFTSPMMMLDVTSIYVMDIDGEEPGDLYGWGNIWDSSAANTVLFSRARSSYLKLWPGQFVPLKDGSSGRAVLHGGKIGVELWDKDADPSPDDLIAKITVVVPENTAEGVYVVSTRRGEKHLIDGKLHTTYGAVNLTYTVQRHWTNFEMSRVRVDRIVGEDELELRGSIHMHRAENGIYGNLSSPFFYQWDEPFVKIARGADLELLRRRGLGIDAALWQFQLYQSKDGVAVEDFVVDKRAPVDQTVAHVVKGSHGQATAYTSWDAQTYRVPFAPAPNLPVTTGDGS